MPGSSSPHQRLRKSIPNSLRSQKGRIRQKVDVRPCVDLRKLNARLPDLEYPLPPIQCILDSVGSTSGPGAIYTTLDIRDGYFCFPIPLEDRNWIACQWQGVHYRFCAAPFGKRTMSAKFQQLMDKIFNKMPFVAVYIDEVVIFSNSQHEHVEHIKAVIELLTRYKLLIRADKSRLGQKTVRLLGFIVSGKGIEMDPAKMEAVENWDRQHTLKQVESFLAAANY